jgi:hypothetical protein
MSSRFTTSWQDVLRQEPLNEARIAAYERLMEAEHRIAEARVAQGVSDQAIDRALEVSEADVEDLSDEDLVVTVLRRFVAELGGRLESGAGSDELAAVFEERVISIPQQPGPASAL